MSINPKQFVVVEEGQVNPSQVLGRVVLVNEDGEPWSPGGEGGPVAWGDVTGKPSNFPSTVGQVSGLQSALDDLDSRIEALEG